MQHTRRNTLTALIATAAMTLSMLTGTSAAAPAPNTATPLEQYEALDSGNQIMFQYYAISGVPIDYPTVAGYMSSDYKQTTDGFRQQDLLKGLRPRIDAALAHAKANHYFRMDIDVTGSSKLSSYDFKRKGFNIAEIFDDGNFRYFGDNLHYRFEFSNGARYKFMPVENEGAARAVEAARSKRESLTLRIYLYANDVNSYNEQTKTVITRIALLGQGGQVLASYAGVLAPAIEKKTGGKIVQGWF